MITRDCQAGDGPGRGQAVRRARTTTLRLAAWLLASAVALPAGAGLLTPLAGAQAEPPAPWKLAGLPKQKLPFTRYTLADLDGARVLRLEAEGSYGHLVHPLPAGTQPHRLRWRWRLDHANEAADLHQRRGDDVAAKVCVMFDLPLARVPFVERQLLRVARARAGEPLPAATVCYVWDPRTPPGTAMDNVYSPRLRMIVLRGQGSPLGEWASELRDVRADFLQLFGQESPQVPPATAVAVSADADNTGGRSLAYVADLVLE